VKTVLLLLVLCPFLAQAQLIKITPEDTYRKHSYLLMRDGSVVRGQIVRQDSSIISVRVRGGDLSFVEADQVVKILAERPKDNRLMVNPSASQTVFVLKDGTQLPGTFVRRNETMITVRKQNGQLTYFEPELLLRVDTLRAGGDETGLTTLGKPAYANRFSPFLPITTTAFNPEKGKGYYRNALFLLNEFHYGVTQNWSVGASVNPFFNVFERDNIARETVLNATYRFFSKLTFPIGNQFRFGVNVTYQPRQKGTLFSMPQQILLHGLFSLGSTERHVTLGYGMRLLPDYTVYSKTPFISAGVMHKISRNLTVLSDNVFYLNPYQSNASANLSLALRFDRRRHAFDLGALSVIQPRLAYYGLSTDPGTYSYFYPYIAYNLLIGRN